MRLLMIRCRAPTGAIAILFVCCLTALAGSSHAADVEAFAGIMAEVRAASERCRDLVVDWKAVAKEKDRLHIEDVDYFAFRKRAHDLADGLEKHFVGGGVATLCDDVLGRYGPEGRSLAGLVRK